MLGLSKFASPQNKCDTSLSLSLCIAPIVDGHDRQVHLGHRWHGPCFGKAWSHKTDCQVGTRTYQFSDEFSLRFNQHFGLQCSLLRIHCPGQGAPGVNIPHVCQFWGNTTLYRPVKGAPKSAYIHDKIAKNGQNGPTFSVFDAKRVTLSQVVAVVTNIS